MPIESLDPNIVGPSQSDSMKFGLIRPKTIDKKEWSFASLDRKPFLGKHFRVFLEVCNSPTCKCTAITVTLYEAAEAGSIYSTIEASAKFTVDIITKQFFDNGTGAQHLLATTFKESLKKEDWLYFTALFMHRKKEICKTIDLDTAHFDFPVKAIEENSELVEYHEVFPFAESIKLSLGEDKFFVAEQYCVIKDCDCREVCVGFLAFDGGKQKKGEHLYVMVNHRTHSFEVKQRGDATHLEPSALMRALLKEAPDFYETANERHQQLKQMYKHYCKDKLSGETLVSFTGKIGRNDPCFCGSGKKYKKCCIGKEIPVYNTPAEKQEPRILKRII